MKDYSYIGSELELFGEAKNWKSYFSSFVKKYLGTTVLEVGAGNGSTTKILFQGIQKRWTCLEPDPNLANTLKYHIAESSFLQNCEVKVGTLLNLDEEETFDSIVYIDVLEHIEDDKQEIRLATNHLKNNGYLIILSPAHQWLFTPFDQSIGHYRRYNKKTLSRTIPKTLSCVKLIYIDSVGLLASLGNRLILKSKMPTQQQILFWDRFMVPLSIKIDPFLGYSVGKTIVGIWQKQV